MTSLIAACAATASLVFALYAGQAAHAIAHRPVAFAGFLVAACCLQLRVVQVPDQGAFSFASICMLASAFYLGTGAGMVVAASAAVVRFVAARGRIDHSTFDVANFALATAAATATLAAAHALDQQPGDRYTQSVFAAAAFYAVNTGLLSVAMGLSEGRSPWRIWQRRFGWEAPFMLAIGPYAELTVTLYRQTGLVGVAGMAIMPLALVTPVRRRMYWSGAD